MLFAINPATSGLFPKCPFLMLTGLKCPGCGSQRAIHCLLHLDIAGAFAYNALLVAALPAVALLVYCETVRTRKPRLYATVNNTRTTWGAFAVVVAWWVVRNVTGW